MQIKLIKKSVIEYEATVIPAVKKIIPVIKPINQGGNIMLILSTKKIMEVTMF